MILVDTGVLIDSLRTHEPKLDRQGEVKKGDKYSRLAKASAMSVDRRLKPRPAPRP